MKEIDGFGVISRFKDDTTELVIIKRYIMDTLTASEREVQPFDDTVAIGCARRETKIKNPRKTSRS